MKVIAFDLDDTLVRWQGPVREAEGARLYDRYIEHLTELIEPSEDTAALCSLRDRFRLGVATNGIGETQRAKLRRADLADLFDFVVVSAEVGVAKPDPAFYEVVCEAAGAAARDIVFVGDSVARDLRPAGTAPRSRPCTTWSRCCRDLGKRTRPLGSIPPT